MKTMKAIEPHHIIVRMPNWLGDLVMATPLLEDLKTKWPKIPLTVMCQGKGGELLLNNPFVDEIFSFKRPSGWLHRESKRHILNPLRHGNYDLGILLTNSLSSAWWFWRGGVKNRIGFASPGRSLLLNEAISFPENKETTHLVEVYKELLKPLGFESSNSSPKLYVSTKEVEEAKEFLRLQNVPAGATLIGINPGAAYGSAKCWLPERFAETTKLLLEKEDRTILYFGDPTGAPLVHKICEQFPTRVVDLAGKTTIRQLMALLTLCKGFLTNDSGPMHMASALGVPLVALFGSTNEIKTGPYNGGLVIHKHVSCSPCYQRICPIDFRCMKEITTKEVVDKIESLL